MPIHACMCGHRRACKGELVDKMGKGNEKLSTDVRLRVCVGEREFACIRWRYGVYRRTRVYMCVPLLV